MESNFHILASYGGGLRGGGGGGGGGKKPLNARSSFRILTQVVAEKSSTEKMFRVTEGKIEKRKQNES